MSTGSAPKSGAAKQSTPAARSQAAAAKQTAPADELAGLLASLQIPTAQFSELVGLIYEGPLEAIPWGTVLTRLRTLLKANWATLVLRPAVANTAALVIRDGGRGAEVYEAAYTQFSVFSTDPFVGLPPDRTVTIDEMIDPAKWINSEFFKHYIEPNQIRYILGADIKADDDAEFRIRVTRPEGGSNFSSPEKALVQVLIPHFRRAVNLHCRLGLMETEMKLYATAMDSMLVGTAVLDESGAVIRTNRIAQAILAEKDGIVQNRNKLVAEYRNEDREFQRLVKLVLDMAPGTAGIAEAMSLTRPSGRTKLGILVRPIPLGEWSEGPHRPAVAIFIRDPERRTQPSSELVRQLFDLTPAEAKLALLLADGLTLDEAAEELAIRKNTIRAHLRSIFSKTGVKRQTALVRLLLSSVASIN